VRNHDLVVIIVIFFVVGISTGFVILDFAYAGNFVVFLIGIFYKSQTGGSRGNAGTGNGEKSTS
jgi:type IV secretory pathway VirB2 component (pilin)